MKIADLLTPERVVCEAQASSKKRVLQQLSDLIAGGQETLTRAEVFESLISRERLGSTGLGRGVAIPHGRVKNSDKTVGAFIRLDTGIDFDAVDDRPVDLLFALLVPEESTDEHLRLLATLAELFSDDKRLQELRQATEPLQIHRLLTAWQSAN